MDKLRAIKFFCRIVEAKSFAAAAHDLDIAPSVLSKVIASLERDIAFRLLNRTTRRVSLTENGARYYDLCKQLVVQLDEAEVLTRNGMARPAGKLLVGLHPAINRVVMTRIDAFLAAYPDIAVETTLVSTTRTLIEDQLDVLIALGGQADSSFKSQRLGTTKPVLVASPSYLVKNGTPRSPEDLTRHTIALSGRRDGPTYARWVLARGRETENVFVPARIVLREGVHMHEACIGGAAICRLLEVSVRHNIRNGDLIVVLPEWSFSATPIVALYPSQKTLPKKVRVFLEFLRDAIRPEYSRAVPRAAREE